MQDVVLTRCRSTEQNELLESLETACFRSQAILTRDPNDRVGRFLDPDPRSLLAETDRYLCEIDTSALAPFQTHLLADGLDCLNALAQSVEQVANGKSIGVLTKQAVSRVRDLRDELSPAKRRFFHPLSQAIQHGVLSGAEFRQGLEAYVAGLKRHEANKAAILYVNSILGIPTFSFSFQHENDFFQPYMPASPLEVIKAIDALHLTDSDNVVDYGAGIFLPSFLFHLLTPAQVSGIEISPEACEIARRTFRELRIDQIEVIEGDIRDHQTSETNVVFMFAPCFGQVMDEVIDRLDTIGRIREGDLRVVALGPIDHGFHSHPYFFEEQVPGYPISIFHSCR